jgi:hypothetical protein
MLRRSEEHAVLRVYVEPIVGYLRREECADERCLQAALGRSRGASEWDKQAVLHLLQSPIPAGLIPCHGEVFPGEHKAIVERGEYERVQLLLAEGSGPLKRWGRNPNYILTGLLRCARCGAAFTPASTRRTNRTYRYYRCATRDLKGREACESSPLPAKAIEDYVVAKLREALADGKPKKYDDPGGTGSQIVHEEVVCPSCAEKS